MTARVLERFGWRLEPRRERLGPALALSLVLAALAAGAILAAMFLAAGADPWTGLVALAKGAFGSSRAVAETLVKATPLILTALAAAVAFRARIWNIGAEGQVFAGAMFAYWCQHELGQASALIQVPIVIAGGMAGGALYGGLAGWLKTRFRVDEIISTVMLNYIIVFALSLLLLKGPWSEARGFFEQTAKVAPNSALPGLFAGSRLHLGLPLALAAAAIVHVGLTRTPLGYDIRAAGSNLRALVFQGTDAGRLVLVVMLLSGALAGLAGVTEVYGVHHRLKPGVLGGLGYTGIIVAILGSLRPWRIVAGALLFGGLVNGATLMQIRTGVPSALVYAIEAVILLFFLAGSACAGFRLRRVEP